MVTDEETLFYLIEFRNQSLVLELYPSVEFISPGVVVEHVNNVRRSRNRLLDVQRKIVKHLKKINTNIS